VCTLVPTLGTLRASGLGTSGQQKRTPVYKLGSLHGMSSQCSTVSKVYPSLHYPPSVATQCFNEVNKSIQVNTRILNKTELACLSNLVAQLDLLYYYRPKETISDFSSGEFNKKGNFVLHNTRFKSRVRQSQLVRYFLSSCASFCYIKALGRRRAWL